jgi:hypothetical protein
MDPSTETPLSQQAVTQSEVVLEQMVRTVLRSGYEACEKGFDLDEVIGETMLAMHPHLVTTASTIRRLGATEERARAAEALRDAQDVILDQIQEG